jgi:prephenate dehydrogenase
MKLRRVSVLGLGLLGGSLCQALRELSDPPVVTGYAHRATTLARAREMRLADAYTSDLGTAARDADLLVLCAPISTFESLLEGIAPHVKAGAVVTDVGSTKRSVCGAARRILGATVGRRFVGSHPMAGGERTGAEHSKPDLFLDAVAIITPEADTEAEAAGVVREMWTGVGSRVITTDPATHDRLVASVSHLPHVTAAMLVTLQTPSALELAGPGYRDTTRIAAGDPALWRDILTDNRDNVLESLRQYQAQLSEFTAILERNDPTALQEYLASAAIKRGSPIKPKNQMV